jgi:hypothetical protein
MIPFEIIDVDKFTLLLIDQSKDFNRSGGSEVFGGEGKDFVHFLVFDYPWSLIF